MTEPVISFYNVSKSYPFYRNLQGIKNIAFNPQRSLAFLRKERFEALRDISFDVYQGESFGIIGKNGAGKSTTLGMIAGFLKPSRGTVIVRGRVSPLLSLGAGFHMELSGRDNIVLNGVLMGLTKRQILMKMDEIIQFSEIEPGFIDSPIRVYSKGMLMRLGFSVVAHLDPEILLIDEVLGVGDIKFQKKCQDKLLSFKESGVTIVLVTHSIGSVAKICTRAMWIDNHTVRMIGDPTEIAESYCTDAGVAIDLGTSNPAELSTTPL